MPTLSSLKIPPPKFWEEFEEITLDACKIRWENPDLQMHGRRGEEQFGVDIYGSNHLFRNIGIQCKNYEKTLSFSLIEKEIQKAESFSPKIEMFYMAVTSNTDATLQKKVRLLSQERAANKQFPVMILFRSDIVQDLVRNTITFNKHYPQFSIKEIKLNKSKDTRLFSLLDLIYNTLNFNFYKRLIFSEYGKMAGENPLQIQTILLTIKYSSNNVLNEADYNKVARLIDKYKDYIFQEEKRETPFHWTLADKISNEFLGIIKGIEYQLDSVESAIYNVAKLLSNWSIWEVDSDAMWPESSWKILIEHINKTKVVELESAIKALEDKYKQLDLYHRVTFPEVVYNTIRNILIMERV